MARPENELKKLYRALGEQSKKFAANRIQTQTSVKGGSLKSKVVPDGRPLGASLPLQARTAKIKVVKAGFDEIHPGLKITVFHSGARGAHVQAPRPVVGLSIKQQVRFAKLINKRLRAIGKKMKLFK